EAALRAVLLNLTPYLIELGLDHARRQLEIMQLIELIEQLTLRLGARLLLVLALDALTQRVLDGVEALKAQLRSPFVVRGALFRRPHGLHLGLELGGFALEIG